MGQSYDHFITLADSAYEAGDYQLSGTYYDDAFAFQIDNGTDSYNAARSWSLTGNLKKSIYYFELSLKGGSSHTWGFVQIDPDLAFMRQHREYEILEKKYHQHKDSVLHFQDVLNLIMNDNSLNTKFKNEFIVMPEPDLSKAYFALLGFEDSIFYMPNRSVIFENCTFINEYDGETLTYIFIEYWNLKSLTINDCKSNSKSLYFIHYSSFDELSLWDMKGQTSIYECNIKDFDFSSNAFERVILMNTTFGGIAIHGENLKELIVKNNIFDQISLNNYLYNIYIGEKIEKVQIINNSFLTDKTRSLVWLNLTCGSLLFRNNIVEYPFTFEGSAIHDKLEIVGNRFNLIDLSGAVFPEINAYIPFDQFDSTSIVLFHKEGRTINPQKVISSSLDEGFNDKENFDRLIYQYQMLYNIYRVRGEIESANLSYIYIKKFQIERYKHIQSSNPSMENYFKLKMGQLLGIYVEHGTNPAKAIVISIYIMLAFSVFYFFFPSEWDVTSKSKLIANFNHFIKKNEKGYFKPFFILLGGLFISLLNALTLSINSFVTLGFGTIPTTGIAKYVCIIQGFIGWFLLSIFSVALINQVLN